LAIVALSTHSGGILTQQGLFFSGTALVTFGGAYAVLAYVAQQAVTTFHWFNPSIAHHKTAAQSLVQGLASRGVQLTCKMAVTRVGVPALEWSTFGHGGSTTVSPDER
jgi:hypothetical protein